MDIKQNEVIAGGNEAPRMGRRAKNFLPRPEELIYSRRGTKVTINLSEESIAYFKEQGERLNTPYQRMIRNLIDEYVRHMKRQEPTTNV
jgi:hypothetical protein